MNFALNPILGRELRARWRDNRSFLLILVVSFLLAVVTVWTYRDRVQWQEEIIRNQAVYGGYIYWRGTYVPMSVVHDVSNSMVDAGRTVFRTVTLFQVAIWLIIAPVIAAPVIAGERERGLLEGLWLTRLHPLSLLVGRLLSCLSLVVVLQMAALPFAAVSLILGGVSPGEIWAGLGLQMLAATTGTSIGLCTSARNHRPPAAMTTIFTVLAFWSLAAFGARQEMNPRHLWSVSPTEDILQGLYLTVAASHPVAAADAWLNRWNGNYSTIPDESVLLGNIAFQILVILIALRFALKAISRPLPELTWLGKNPIIERYRRELNNLAAARMARQEARAGFAERAGQTLLFELPVHLFVRFRNPLLQREVKSRFRFRRVPLILSLLRALVITITVGAWLVTILNITDPISRRGMASSILYLLCIGGIPATGLLGATAFSRERESGTWEGLRLALLTSWDIIWAKWRAPLITVLYFSAPFWLLLPFTGSWLLNGTAPVEILLKVLVMVSVMGATAAGALWCSWRCPNSTTASAWVLTVLLLAHVAGPPIADATRLSSRLASYAVPERNIGAYYPQTEAWNQYQIAFETAKAVAEAPLVINSMTAWDKGWRTDAKPEQVAVVRNISTIIFYVLVTAGFFWSLRFMVEREIRERRPLRSLPLRRPLAPDVSTS